MKRAVILVVGVTLLVVSATAVSATTWDQGDYFESWEDQSTGGYEEVVSNDQQGDVSISFVENATDGTWALKMAAADDTVETRRLKQKDTRPGEWQNLSVSVDMKSEVTATGTGDRLRNGRFYLTNGTGSTIILIDFEMGDSDQDFTVDDRRIRFSSTYNDESSITIPINQTVLSSKTVTDYYNFDITIIRNETISIDVNQTATYSFNVSGMVNMSGTRANYEVSDGNANNGDWHMYYDNASVTSVATYTLSGHVNDLDGDPVANATVDSDRASLVTSSSNGSYSIDLPEGENEITVSKPGYETETFTVDMQQDTELNVTLNTLYNVSGYVKNASGDGLSATVQTTDKAVSTNSSGFYEIKLADGSYDLKAISSGYGDKTKDLTVDDSDIENFNFTLEQAFNVSGYVKDTDGNVVDGARVEVNDSGESGTTNSSGYYELEVPNGTWTLTADKDGYIQDSQEITMSGTALTDTNFTLEAANWSIEGYVKAENGSGLRNIDMEVAGVSESATTNRSGYYRLDLNNGTWDVTAKPRTKKFRKQTQTFTIAGDDITNANYTLEGVELQLKVPSHMWPNTSDGYEVWDVSGDFDREITDLANVTSSDPTNLTVHESNNTLVATSDVTFSGEVKITANYSDKSVSRNVTIANKSVENVDKFQNAADMFAGLWGDPVNPNTGERKGGTQLTMRVLFIAVLLGAAIVPLASAFAGIGMTTLVVAMGWFMGWVGDGMALITVFTGLFIGMNVVANIDYSVRR